MGVFAFDRASVLERTLDALERCEGFDGGQVHVYCDAPREDSAGVDAVRAAAREWCLRHRARLVLRERNLHFRNITEGITELTENEGVAISLEDDHLPARNLLRFLERGLERFERDDRVFQVAGYLPGTATEGEPHTAFLPVPMPSGWATWRRAWRHFQWEIGPDQWPLDAERRHRFDLGGAYPAAKLVESALAGRFDSYFVRWYLAMFHNDGLALCSTTALVLNSGLASGVHARPPSAERSAFFNGRWRGAGSTEEEWLFPESVGVDATVLENFVSALRTRQR